MFALKPLTLSSTTSMPRVSYRLTDNGLVTVSGQARHRAVFTFDVTRLTMFADIPDSDKLKAKDLLRLIYLTYLYTLRLVNTKMIRRLTDVPYDAVTQTRDAVFNSMQLVQYKVATLRCVAAKLRADQPEQIAAHFQECGLRREDGMLFSLLCMNNDIHAFVALVKTIEDPQLVLTVDSFVRELERNTTGLRTLQKEAGWKAWSKLRFIAHGNRQEHTDPQGDLLLKAIQVYRWVRPFYSQAHAINYARRSIPNLATDIIRDTVKDEYKARTVATADGYDNMMRSYTEDLDFTGNPREVEDNMVEYLDTVRALA